VWISIAKSARNSNTFISDMSRSTKYGRDHQTLLNLDAKAQSSDDRIEYTLRLLAIVERHTEEMGEIAGAFNKVILSHADRKKNGE
jgi:hypothetical protein